MIVVDSSVMIDHLNNRLTRQVELLRANVPQKRIIIGDIVMVEILRGLRDDREAAAVERALRRFRIATMLDETLAVQAAANYRALRGVGITISKTIDLIIGSFCIANRHVLLHNDRDFLPMSQYLGLQSLAAAPH
jgi:predicted nucleic acid-binding protein